MEKSNEALTKRDALRWLEMQRDAVNTEIVYAAQTEKKQYHKYLEIINALAERVNEMTAVEYFEAKVEMCSVHSCEECPLNRYPVRCRALEYENPRDAVAATKQWKEEQS